MASLGGHNAMNYLYLTESAEELYFYQAFAERNVSRIEVFLNYLIETFAVTELPNAVVLTSAHIATKQISDISLPAYTNAFRTIFCPDTNIWRSLYLQQLKYHDDPVIRKYYTACLTENHTLQILGHEFVHHSDFFLDEAFEKARWFEEGMCEYISRKWVLTEKEFEEELRINELLTTLYEKSHGIQSVEHFTRDIYEGTLEDIFYFYWKSFLTVYAVVQRMGDPEAVFREYHRWFREAPDIPLSSWFET